MNRIVKFRAYTEISNEVLGMKYDVPHNYNDTVMQYTGLKDKLGNDIYEGDILQTGLKDFVWRDVIEHGWATNDGEVYGWHWGRGGAVRPQDCISERMEIIGNLYQNPELLPSYI